MPEVMSGPVRLKVRLQSEGIRVRGAGRAFWAGARPEGVLPGAIRLGGAGPAEGVTIFFDGLSATVPCRAPFAGGSKFHLASEDGRLCLFEKGRFVTAVEVPDEPRFYSRGTSTGMRMGRVAVRHGRDAIGSTVAQACDRGCSFCAIGLTRESGATTAIKTPREIGEVAKAAMEEGFAHFVLTTGTSGADCGIEHMSACAESIRLATGGRMPVHVQFEPPADPEWILVASASADTAAVNMECFDADTLGRVAPFKAATGLAAYERAWKAAVEAFGPGQVSCFLIAGLGEPRRSIIEGCRVLASLGVFPFVLPLRPVPGTSMGTSRPPDADTMAGIYEEAREIIDAAGLTRAACRAGCVRCGACSAIGDLT